MVEVDVLVPEGSPFTLANLPFGVARGRVHVAFGHYDGATAYFAAEHVLAHLRIPEELRENLDMAYYPAGHMMYVHEPTRVQQSKDLAKFVKKASNR